MSQQSPESAAPSGQPPTFEEALVRLESIVRDLEEGQIGLAEGLAGYEEGIKLLRQCYQLLENAERRIDLLNRVDPDGRAHCEELDDGAISLEEKAQTRSRRRSSAKPGRDLPPEDEIDAPGQLF